MVVIHHKELRRRLKPRYDLNEVRELIAFLRDCGTLSFNPLPTGLYPAAGIDPVAAAQSGYGNVWVRDNVYVAFAHDVAGQWRAAKAVVAALAVFYSKYRNRFEAMVERYTDPKLPMNRPQVRFDGLELAEIPTRWAHAQNDALGYFLWLYCRLACNGRLVPDGNYSHFSLCTSSASAFGRTRTAGTGKRGARSELPALVPYWQATSATGTLGQEHDLSMSVQSPGGHNKCP